MEAKFLQFQRPIPVLLLLPLQQFAMFPSLHYLLVQSPRLLPLQFQLTDVISLESCMEVRGNRWMWDEQEGISLELAIIAKRWAISLLAVPSPGLLVPNVLGEYISKCVNLLFGLFDRFLSFSSSESDKRRKAEK